MGCRSGRGPRVTHRTESPALSTRRTSGEGSFTAQAARPSLFFPPMSATTHQRWMSVALDQARDAAAAGEVPVGAVIIRNGEAIAQAGNRTLRDQDPTAHAEALVIRDASAQLGSWRLEGCSLY